MPLKGIRIIWEQQSEDSLSSPIFPVVLPEPEKGTWTGQDRGPRAVLCTCKVVPVWALTVPGLGFNALSPKYGESQGEGLRGHGLGRPQLPPSAPHPQEQSPGLHPSILSCGETGKKAPAFWEWLAMLQLKPIPNSLSKRKKEPLDDFKVQLILIVYCSFVLSSHWMRECWATAPRRNIGSGSRQPLVTILSTDQYITVFHVCFYLKTHYLIYTFGSWILNSPKTLEFMPE